MFAKFALSFVSLLVVSQPAAAGDRLCQREFVSTVVNCAQSLRTVKPKLRANALKACVVDAKEDKRTCLAGGGGEQPDQCSTTCQANYDANAVTCQNTFDPSVCGGVAGCEAFYQSERANCLAGEVDTLNACNAACPQ